MELVCIDTSVLIDHFRASDKRHTFLFRLTARYRVQIPAIVRYEILRGDRLKDNFWLTYFARQTILPFDADCAGTAAHIYALLKAAHQLIGAEDILIAATAFTHKLPLATANVRHFSRIDQLQLITPDQLTA